MVKPMRAADWDRKKVKFPLIYEPKIDGVRGLNINNAMSARSLKPFGNRHTNLFFSQNAFRGFDGELAAESETHSDLCRLTTSATSTHTGEPWLMWHVFDYITPETTALPYIERLVRMEHRVAHIKETQPLLGQHLKPIQWSWAYNMAELELVIDLNIERNYEGTIIRDPNGKYKEGYSSPTQGGLLRIKPFIHVDAEVTKLYEGEQNGNEAQLNELGQTFRSTHKANMVPNGMVGAMDARLLEDAVFNDQILFHKGDIVKFGAGRMPHDQRALFWIRQDLILGKKIKGQIFPKGILDKPRFPTFQSFRSDEDFVAHI